MKAKNMPGPTRYNPVTIMLTFETKEELEVIENMAGHDVSVTNLIIKSSAARAQDEEIVKKFFSEIYWALDAAGNAS